MKLVVGLGNPGSEYKNTRHNIGYMYLDYLFGTDFTLNNKFLAMEKEVYVNNEKIMIIKPTTYMNLSGEAVLKYVNYYKIGIDDILIIQDDLDMDIGSYKLMYNHGDGGHNGIKNIILNLSSKCFLRLKIGISKDKTIDTKNYVLSKFDKTEIDKLNNVFLNLKDFISDFEEMNRDKLIGKYNTMNNNK